MAADNGLASTAHGVADASSSEIPSFVEAASTRDKPIQALKGETSSTCHADRKNGIDVRVTNMSGEVVANLQGVPAEELGRGLKRMIANVAGFPATGLALILASGRSVEDDAPLNLAIGNESASHASVAMTCTLAPARPCGEKSERCGVESVIRKGGGMLVSRVDAAERKGLQIISTVRVPDPRLRADAQDLITKSFAPGLIL